MSETRTFKPHPKLLMDVIRRQAGTLSKAVLEAVMNSVDAGSTKCEIKIDKNEVLITDDGKGFVDRHEVEQFFEVFGTPHEEGDAVYGQFRMGRGQLFAFGLNVWRSNSFRMVVDVLNKGLDYEFHEGEGAVTGCRVAIKLYSPLTNICLRETLEEIRRFVAHVSTPVLVNGEAASKPPAEQKWDHEGEWGWLRFTQGGSFKVYNLGVFVQELPGCHFGVGGVFVSRRQLKVNFARNQVMSDCPVWQKAKSLIRKRAMKGLAKKPVLDDAGRERLAAAILEGSGSRWEAHGEWKVITDVQGRHHTINRAFRRNAVVTWTADNDRTGDAIMQSGRAFVVAASTLDRFGARDLDGLFEALAAAGVPSYYLDVKIVSYSKLAEEMQSSYTIIPEAKWRPSEKLWMGIAETMIYKLEVEEGGRFKRFRRAMVGDTEPSTLGWTDGETYVAINRRHLEGLRPEKLADLHDLAHIIVHELCHDGPDTDKDIHGHEFYRDFHERSRAIGKVVGSAFSSLAKTLSRHSMRLTKLAARQLDKTQAAEDASQRLSAVQVFALGVSAVKKVMGKEEKG